MKNFLTFGFTLLCLSNFAQETCNCLDNLNKAIDKVSNNYAGYTDKVNSKSYNLYNTLVDNLKKSASQNNTDTACLKILRSYTNFFKDGHLGVSFTRKLSSNDTFSIQPGIDNDIPSVSFKGDKWAIIKIPSFSIEYNDTIHKLFLKHKIKLENCQSWIIDLRGNDGGSKAVYEPIFPYIFTNPIVVEGSKQWCSKDNVKAAREEFDDYKNKVDSLTRVGWEEYIKSQEANIGKWLSGSGDTIIFKVKKHPRKVAILVDKGCASSTEIFIMKAMQSKKVTLLGTNTNGTVDYGDVKYWDDMPCKSFNLRIATTRWNWIDKAGPIDPTGTRPNIAIPVITTDWISYTMQHLK